MKYRFYENKFNRNFDEDDYNKSNFVNNSQSFIYFIEKAKEELQGNNLLELINIKAI